MSGSVRREGATGPFEPTTAGLGAPWSGREPIIHVPLDGSKEAKAALPAARLAASLARASVHIVHVSNRPLADEDLLRRINLTREETHGTVVDQVVGSPPETIVRVAREQRAMLIVMTTRGRTAYGERIVRPVAEYVIRSADCPVLLIRPEIAGRVAATKSLQSILLPLDGAPSSAAVIGPALDLAERSGARVDVLYVATSAERPVERGTLTAPRYLDQLQYEWPAWTREFMSRFCAYLEGYPSPVPRRLFLRRGEPAAEILRFAVEHDSDLIVLEWRGQLYPPRAQVVRNVLVDAPCPVLLLRTARHPEMSD